MLILGCDIVSETHYVRAIDTRGLELSKSALAFDNNLEGFQSAKDWAVNLAAKNNKNQIVLGLEPTGHYWFCLASWMVSNGISVVQVNPYAVKQTKEIEDNSQAKNDLKDPKLIANLVKDGNYGMPYLPEGLYAENILEIAGVGERVLTGILAEIADEFKELHIYYTTRQDNPLKKLQSLIVIACKLLRVIYKILTKGITYDPQKMLLDIRRQEKVETIVA
ncbi:MAG: transposase [Eubacteriales bacterium]